MMKGRIGFEHLPELYHMVYDQLGIDMDLDTEFNILSVWNGDFIEVVTPRGNEIFVMEEDALRTDFSKYQDLSSCPEALFFYWNGENLLQIDKVESDGLYFDKVAFLPRISNPKWLDQAKKQSPKKAAAKKKRRR